MLTNVICGRVIDAFGTGQINAVGYLFVSLLTHNKHILAQTVNLEVTGHGQGFHECNAVFGDFFYSSSCISQYGKVHIVKDHGDHWVLDKAFGNELVFDKLCHFLAGKSLNLYWS